MNCNTCAKRENCNTICNDVENSLPSMEKARIDAEDIRKLLNGKIETSIILDYSDVITEKQRKIVDLYYRENLQQKDIAQCLAISQQAVNDTLTRARIKIGKVSKINIF